LEDQEEEVQGKEAEVEAAKALDHQWWLRDQAARGTVRPGVSGAGREPASGTSEGTQLVGL
jgi:hypothetical protein